jgi:predicted CopG family antitoxin
MRRRVINISDDLYGELITIKGKLEQERKEHVSLEGVIAYLLQVYKSSKKVSE